MATDTVTTNADSGAGSLRAVLASAAAGDTIVFSPTVFTNAATDDIQLASSLTITQNVTIEGHVGGGSGAANIEIDGQNAVTDLVINAGVSASLDGLLIENGDGVGAAGGTAEPGAAAAGGIFDSGTLTLSNSVLMGDTATGGAGANGAYTAGNSGSQASSTGGQAGGAAAGGIYVATGATLNLLTTTNAFSSNTATGGNGGAGGPGGTFRGPTIGGAGGTGGYATSAGNTDQGATYGTAGPNGYKGVPGGAGGAPGQAGAAGQNYSYSFAFGSMAPPKPAASPGGGGGGGNAFADDGGQGTIQTVSVACYCRGTRILTVRGEMAVEALRVGDLVVTFAGSDASLKPIRWLGHRRVDLRRHPDPENTRPIRFRAGSLGEGCPHRDLLVSPGHRMRVDDVLVTALELVNGASIVQENLGVAEYWHIDLNGHDLVLAEGVQAETYVDTGNRTAFENGAVAALHPALDGDAPKPCLPYAGASAKVRARLIARAEALGWTRTIDPAPWLEVDGAPIEPIRQGTRWRFDLPAGCRAVQLRSRAGRAWDVDAHSGDRRHLGLKLHHLALDGREIALASADLHTGFHPVEQDAEGRVCRWTTGNTTLALADLAPGETVTAIEIGYDQALSMWVEPVTMQTHGAATADPVARLMMAG